MLEKALSEEIKQLERQVNKTGKQYMFLPGKYIPGFHTTLWTSVEKNLSFKAAMFNRNNLHRYKS